MCIRDRPKILQQATLTPQDVLLELGLGDGELLIAAAKQVRQCIGIELGEGCREAVEARVREHGVEDRVIIRDIPLYSLAQELDLSQVTVLLVHVNQSYSAMVAAILNQVTHPIRVISVSYTHLTLPTIYSVYISVVAVSL
eukprot:TRINITY_DN16665_c0_g1_i1.p1 TRINITY_DN16665_c0_g1~~TRINITY_DN16665_c0_g1_i1.p1  ORF type:complete len:141 (+),score=26.65 TRINITY_DN16665_c0_g1_i1:73-495(+)